MNIVFDLDGTLIDSSERMYRLFQTLIPQSNFSKEQYWSMKRNKMNHRMILEEFFPQLEFEEFNKKWLSLIEDDNYLIMDCNYPDTIEVLSKLDENNKLVLLTARQSEEAAISELKRLSLFSFFNKILVTQNKYTKDYFLKSMMNHDEKMIYVSDMGKDIEAGKINGYITVGITHGFMSEDKLREYNPHYMISELSQFDDQVLRFEK